MDNKLTTPDLMAADYAALGSLEDVAIDLEVTSVCDAVCTFCPREHMPDKKRFLAMEVVDRLARELRYHRIAGIVLCGIGESTLHPQLNEIVRTLSDTGTSVEMTTHGGARLDTGRFETLVQHGLSGFSFSLNAHTAETHQKVMRLKDFDRTVHNVREIIALRDRAHKRVSIHVSFVVCAANHREVEDFVEEWRRYQGVQIWLHPLNNRNTLLSPDMTPVDVTRLADIYKDDPRVIVDVFRHLSEDPRLCKVAKSMIFISADGIARLCAMDYRRVTSYGSLLERSLEDIQRIKLAMYRRGENNEFCSDCDFCPSSIRSERRPVHVLRAQ